MSETSYNYTISTDFPNHVMDSDRLTQEIRASAIVTALSHIATADGICSVWFRDALSQTDEGILDDIVAAHSGESLTPTALPVQLYSGTHAAPVASDGRLYISPNIFPEECYMVFTGSGDKITEPQDRFGGDLCLLEKNGQGDSEMDLRFIDGVYIAGGHISWTGGDPGAYIYMELRSDASTVKAPQTPGEGNCNLVATGLGFNMIVPAAGNGQYDLDYAAPVPAYHPETNAKTGYWEYSEPWIGKGTVSAGVAQHSKYNLYDEGLELNHFAKILLLTNEGTRDMFIPAMKPKWLLPEWYLRIELHNANNAKNLHVAWDLLLGRRKTT